MNALVPANFGSVSTKFKDTPPVDDLSSGIQSSFGLIGYKGKVWSIRYRGDETPLMRDDGDGPRGSIEVVILKASQHISKIWYEQGYVEGSNAAPDCFSNNGVVPEPTSLKKQCESCALCPHNQWGSRVTPAGKAGKSCADSKRLAVVPQIDLQNEAYGGAMLLRVPAASLNDVAGYGQKMQQMGYPYYSVATRISFDANESYPKFVFGAIRPLNDDEADVVLAMRDSHTVERILSDNEFATTPAQDPGGASVFEQPPEDKVTSTGNGTIAADVAKAAAATKAKAEADAKAKKAADAKAKKDADAKAKAEADAKAAEQAQETDEEREERELLAQMAALKAKKAAAKAAAEMEATAQTASQVVDEAPEEGGNDNPLSDFENDLDSMLNELLPS